MLVLDIFCDMIVVPFIIPTTATKFILITRHSGLVRFSIRKRWFWHPFSKTWKILIIVPKTQNILKFSGSPRWGLLPQRQSSVIYSFVSEVLSKRNYFSLLSYGLPGRSKILEWFFIKQNFAPFSTWNRMTTEKRLRQRPGTS